MGRLMCNCLSELENESVLETRLLIGWTRYVNPSEAWLLKHHGQRYYILQKKHVQVHKQS